jgi:hypothetical protein
MSDSYVPPNTLPAEKSFLAEVRIRKILLDPDHPTNGHGSFCRNHGIKNLVVDYTNAQGDRVRIEQCDESAQAAARREP